MYILCIVTYIHRGTRGAIRRLKQNISPDDDVEDLLKSRVQMIKLVYLGYC